MVQSNTTLILILTVAWLAMLPVGSKYAAMRVAAPVPAAAMAGAPGGGRPSVADANAGGVAGGGRVRKKLIEFGWDEPDPAFMRRHIREMEATPFDGCVFHLPYVVPGQAPGRFTWESWGRRTFLASEIQGALDDLKATPITRFKDNFLRFNVTPGDVDWFDDYSAILSNARLAARIAKEGGCKGILFDLEPYMAPVFDYRKQRDARTKTWDEYAEQARRRGREVMQAFQSGYPDVTILLAFGYSTPWLQLEAGATSLADCSFGLIAPFLDGMVDVAAGSTRIIDGNESAYGFRDTTRLERASRATKHDLLPIVRAKEKYAKVVSLSYGIWMDHDWRTFGWNTEDLSKNYHTPLGFERIVRKALDLADEYVWIYTETPRWWSDSGSVKVPDAYDRALRNALRGR